MTCEHAAHEEAAMPLKPGSRSSKVRIAVVKSGSSACGTSCPLRAAHPCRSKRGAACEGQSKTAGEQGAQHALPVCGTAVLPMLSSRD